jgi:hypothetical protein
MPESIPNLYRRLLAIVHDSGALKKGGKTSYGDNYAYHKVDDVVDHLRPLFIEHGVVMLTSVVERHLGEAGETSSKKTQWRAEALLAITFVNVDDPAEKVTINGWGEGVDTSDKGVGKAIAYALKNALLATFFLRGQPDVEAEHHEGRQRRAAPEAAASARPPAASANGGPPKEALARLVADGLKADPPLDKKALLALAMERFGKKVSDLNLLQFNALVDRVNLGDWLPDDIDEALPSEGPY